MTLPADVGRQEERARELRQFLEMTGRLRARNRRPEGWRYGGVEDFLLALGRPWEPAVKPKGVRWGTPRLCFMNAYKLALRRPELTYVEGYAVRHIPTHHAWCVDGDGRVVDNTWRPDPGEEGPAGAAYFGVPLLTDYVSELLQRQRTYGILYPHGPESDGLYVDEPLKFLRCTTSTA